MLKSGTNLRMIGDPGIGFFTTGKLAATVVLLLAVGQLVVAIIVLQETINALNARPSFFLSATSGARRYRPRLASASRRGDGVTSPESPWPGRAFVRTAAMARNSSQRLSHIFNNSWNASLSFLFTADNWIAAWRWRPSGTSRCANPSGRQRPKRPTSCRRSSPPRRRRPRRPSRPMNTRW